MSTGRFRGWFSDVGFTCRVLIICDMLEEFAESWKAEPDSPMWQAIAEVRETAILEMDRWEEVARIAGYLSNDSPPTYPPPSETLGPIVR